MKIKNKKYLIFAIQILLVISIIFGWNYFWVLVTSNKIVFGLLTLTAGSLWLFFGINSIVTHYVDSYKIGGIENLKDELVMGLTILYTFGLFVLFFVGISNGSDIQIYLSFIGAALGILRAYIIKRGSK